MKPIDYRNETWDQVWQRMDALRLEVYRALGRFGPTTTRQLAIAADIDLLSLRPRVTELFDLGLVELADPEAKGREGVYRAVPYAVALARFEKLKAHALAPQLDLL